MSKKKLVFSVVGFAVVGIIAIYYSLLRSPDPAFIDPADKHLVMQGKVVYAKNCAVCHGGALEGQPNWRERMPNGRLPAPPHDKTGHTWHHPDAMLIDMVKNSLVPGRTAPRGYDTDMPAYRDILTDEETIAVLAYIKSSWPPKVLEAQKEVTLRTQE
ncbi:c-type cytochrome [Pusillimonas sp.]|uniref:c-type cytochrome n=1 Tax=Pusillimonas sp. TaxID=3040095 RepID=UPI0037CC1BA2